MPRPPEPSPPAQPVQVSPPDRAPSPLQVATCRPRGLAPRGSPLRRTAVASRVLPGALLGFPSWSLQLPASLRTLRGGTVSRPCRPTAGDRPKPTLRCRAETAPCSLPRPGSRRRPRRQLAPAGALRAPLRRARGPDVRFRGLQCDVLMGCHRACCARHRAPRRPGGRRPSGRDPTPRRPLPWMGVSRPRPASQRPARPLHPRPSGRNRALRGRLPCRPPRSVLARGVRRLRLDSAAREPHVRPRLACFEGRRCATGSRHPPHAPKGTRPARCSTSADLTADRDPRSGPSEAAAARSRQGPTRRPAPRGARCDSRACVSTSPRRGRSRPRHATRCRVSPGEESHRTG